jgi:hypothetical protein
VLEVAAAEDQQPVEGLGADAADEALGAGVCLGCEVSRVLGDPAAGRVGRAAREMDASAFELNEEQT